MFLIYILLNFAIFGLIFFTQRQLRKFLSCYQKISNYRDLDAFKDLARLDMYMALAFIVLMIGSMIIGTYLTRIYKLPILPPLFILKDVVLFLLSRILKPLEVRARSLDCATPELAHIHSQVSKAWVKNFLPNF